jgi:hypothetical protein
MAYNPLLAPYQSAAQMGFAEQNAISIIRFLEKTFSDLKKG